MSTEMTSSLARAVHVDSDGRHSSSKLSAIATLRCTLVLDNVKLS